MLKEVRNGNGNISKKKKKKKRTKKKKRKSSTKEEGSLCTWFDKYNS